jgi:polyphosphate kinase
MYRIAKDSHILHALINAAKNGKRVIAIVEVQARFDEQHNLEITKMLQEAGVKVIPGIPGLKVHCKVFQISRKINGRTTRITHIGTGNFHEKTARLYSDTTLITSHLEIGREVRKLFDFFESNFLRPQFRHLAVSPFNTRRKLVDAIAGEVQEAKEGREGRVVIKVNNLVDEVLIKKLLDAAEAGVKVSLIVRGVCLLEPVTPKQKANIDMRSILGRYLEHSRLFVFGVGDRMQIYLGSADLMVRNLDFRVEVLVPIYDVKLKQEIWEWLSIQLSNEVRARNLSPERINQMWMPKLNVETVDSQVVFRDYLSKKYLKA